MNDLVDSTPGKEEGGLLVLAKRSPCDPRTLTRASRDWADTEPVLSFEVGITALHLIIQGYGYEITGGDVFETFDYTMEAATSAGTEEIILERIKELVTGNSYNRQFVREVWGRRLT